jgi:hypothetical protein
MTKCLGMSCGGLCRSTKSQQKYITLIKNMYDNIMISVQTSDGDTNDFPINIWLYQGSALSHYLFALVINEVIRDIQGDIS